jgi:hypothetical protein
VASHRGCGGSSMFVPCVCGRVRVRYVCKDTHAPTCLHEKQANSQMQTAAVPVDCSGRLHASSTAAAQQQHSSSSTAAAQQQHSSSTAAAQQQQHHRHHRCPPASPPPPRAPSTRRTTLAPRAPRSSTPPAARRADSAAALRKRTGGSRTSVRRGFWQRAGARRNTRAAPRARCSDAPRAARRTAAAADPPPHLQRRRARGRHSPSGRPRPPFRSAAQSNQGELQQARSISGEWLRRL